MFTKLAFEKKRKLHCKHLHFKGSVAYLKVILRLTPRKIVNINSHLHIYLNLSCIVITVRSHLNWKNLEH